MSLALNYIVTHDGNKACKLWALDILRTHIALGTVRGMDGESVPEVQDCVPRLLFSRSPRQTENLPIQAEPSPVHWWRCIEMWNNSPIVCYSPGNKGLLMKWLNGILGVICDVSCPPSRGDRVWRRTLLQDQRRSATRSCQLVSGAPRLRASSEAWTVQVCIYIDSFPADESVF